VLASPSVLRVLVVCCALATSQTQASRSETEPSVSEAYFIEGVQANIDYGNGLKLDAYAPPAERRPAAVLIHGSSGDKSTHLTQLFPLLARAGYAWFSVNYRGIADMRTAAAFIEHQKRFSVEPRPLLIAEDTGVTLAFQLAKEGGFGGVIGFGAAKNVAGMRDPGVPVTLFHGAADTDVDPKPLEAACRTWKKCRFESIANGIHNLENWHPAEWDWKEEFSAILRNGRPGLWKDIVYSRPGGMALTMDAHLPPGRGPASAIIVVHGGGWEAGDKLTYVSPVLSLLSHTEFAWFSIDYRLTPYVRNQEQLEDLRNAIRYVRLHAERFNVNPNSIAVLGESAGGQLVTQVASEPCSGCEVQAVVSFYGVYDFVPWAANAQTKPMLDRVFGNWDRTKLARYSPIAHVRKGMPPVLMLQGTADELYAGTVAYEKRLAEAGVSHELILLDGAPHGMENWVGHPQWETYEPKLVEWLEAVLASTGASRR
jgi:acetyl esterase